MNLSNAAICRREEVLTLVCADSIAPETLDRVLRGTRIVHTIPGRVRLRIPILRLAPELAGSLEALLKAQPGFTGVSVNRWCQSVTLNYDSLYWTSDTINAFLQQLRRSQIEEYKPVVAESRIQASTYWRVAGYIALVVGIILFALPMVPGGTPLLFLSTLCFSKADAFKLEQVVAAIV